ncbi:MAG: FAD-dependent oxidoreductase [Proteobacteria bacterium]|nr:FAD-dependent oxidoreductase [Pseudomonadota bacterium]MBU1455170.1 FAD-dependent oxidoreductase [Pseudomonadota bacterium]
MPPRILILGAGPTGLGAALRCVELGYTNWKLYEKNPTAGGLAGSLRDSKGFSWDFGGHVFFSKYKRIHDLIQTLGSSFFISHSRRAFIHLFGLHIPYPFQQHLEHLPQDISRLCRQTHATDTEELSSGKDFKTWLEKKFGPHQYRIFFCPYNTKVCGYPLSELSSTWMDQRISPPSHIEQQKNWGPNSRFYYPVQGGMGGLFQSLAQRVNDFIAYDQEIIQIDPINRTIKCQSGLTDSFDMLISTGPLTKLITALRPNAPETIESSARRLRWNSSSITGMGFRGATDKKATWVYYPEPQFSFHRVSALSSYSADVVPDNNPDRFSSFLCETTLVDSTKVPSSAEILSNLYNTNLSLPVEHKELVSATQIFLPYSYPIPTCDREHHLSILQSFLESNSIYSRGRFGGWRYETGNMDHCLLQGMEIIDRLLLDKKETVYRMP